MAAAQAPCASSIQPKNTFSIKRIISWDDNLIVDVFIIVESQQNTRSFMLNSGSITTHANK
ncbi:hypothetical protein BFJ71_g8433 [Fusarium oxysporum]|nr:hypothetical protein BFJ71_g8433 [Fusarium oxysporum]